MTRSYRIGCGAGFSADRLPPALDLIEHGGLDALIVECVGERTLAFGHRDRMLDSQKGYNGYLDRRMRAMLPLCHRHGVKLITNMGVANPLAAGNKTAEIGAALGLRGLTIAVLTGDDVTWAMEPTTRLWEGMTIGELSLAMVGANAYLGAEHMLPALEADIIITGRVADPSLSVAPLMHHFGWGIEDWHELAASTLAGHLIECGMQVTGGYYADPPYKSVPNLADCGYPIAEIDAYGAIEIGKLERAGGAVNLATVKEQLLYEVHDPNAYVTPDVIADFGHVALAEIAPDRVRIKDARGMPRPPDLKVTVGFDAGYLAEAGISYGGPGAADRAALARDVLRQRLHAMPINIRYDIIGVDALHVTAGPALTTEHCIDARLRVAARSKDMELLEMILWETEALLCSGPAGGGGFRRALGPSVATYSTSLPRDRITSQIEWIRI